MQPISFEEILEHILTQDARYHRDGFFFVREALDYTHKVMGKESKSSVTRHVTAQQLLAGIREYALEQFGPMAITVFEEWNIRSCRDFGEIVFIMIEYSLLAKTDKDTIEDFAAGYDFDEAFRKPFLPQTQIGAGTKESKPAKT